MGKATTARRPARSGWTGEGATTPARTSGAWLAGFLVILALAGCSSVRGEFDGYFSPGANPAAERYMAAHAGKPIDELERLTAVSALAMAKACPALVALSRETAARHREAMAVAAEKEGPANVERQVANMINSTRATGCAQNAADVVNNPDRYPFLTARTARAG